MQLILDTETTVDLKAKMSLTGDNLEKCVSDVVPGVQNGNLSNGDAINENNETTQLKDNNDFDKLEQHKDTASENGDSLLEHSNATIRKSHSENEASHDSKSTDISSENNSNFTELVDNLEPVEQANNINECDEAESATVKNGNDSENGEIVANIEPVKQSNNVNETEETRNAALESEKKSDNSDLVANIEPVEYSHNVNKTEKIVSVEKDNTDHVSNSVESEFNYDRLPENNINKHVNESGNSNIAELDRGNIEKIPDSVSNTGSDTDTNPSELLNIKEEIDETAAGSDTDTNPSELLNIKKEIDETAVSASIETEEDDTIKIKEIYIKSEELPIKEEQLDRPELNIENNDDNITLPTLQTEPIENTPISKGKETMETDNTETDTSDENIDLIRLDFNGDSCDKVNDSVIHEADKEELSPINQAPKESISDNVTEMDVDTIADHVDEIQKKEIDSVTPTASIIEHSELHDCELKETDTTIVDKTLHLKTNSSDAIVNLEDDKNTIDPGNVKESESTQIIEDDDKPIINCDDDTETGEKTEKSINEDSNSIDEVIDLDENAPKETRDTKLSDEKSKGQQINSDVKTIQSTEPIEPILKLSNTLDILSDDEVEQEPKSSNTDSKCIDIEDDDDIMLIDDDTSGMENKSEPIKEQEIVEPKPQTPTENVNITEDIKSTDKIKDVPVEDTITISEKEVTEDIFTPDISEKIEEKKETLQAENTKPLIPEKFLKTCKKNLVEMTKEELEEFCILKIVESILDRSNLSEIKNKLKMLTQNIEDYKKKAMMLTKQNRDLQVVLKSVQEDVKKYNATPIVPLKITRSVGMQVLMSDKPEKRRRTGIGMPNPNANKMPRTSTMQSPRPCKPSTQQIPVPRLVPANNPAIKSPVQQVNAGKVTTQVTNGIKSVSPVQKAEKRTHNRIQSVTVDLTDDEPPVKVVSRNSAPVPPVRLVPSQNLMAPRTPGVNSPRKVYIPISGPQGQNVRPGQTIMLKTVPAANPRQRVPPPHMVRMPPSIRMTRPQGMRHPAPLPECMKQYQPPNWKALPPAPDLKLAKVENGIVISWKIEGYQEDSYEEIASYQLYAYQETSSPPNTALWKKIGDVKALPLPMACTLTQFMAGYKYYFAVRAVDIRSRLGPFSLPGSILLLNKM